MTRSIASTMLASLCFVPPAQTFHLSARLSHYSQSQSWMRRNGNGKFSTQRASTPLFTARWLEPHAHADAQAHELSPELAEPQDEIMEPMDLPQTMEKAILDAQHAVLNALGDGERRIVCQLPMGRLRTQWNTTTPPAISYQNTLQLYPHLLEPMRDGNVDVRIVYDSEVCGADRCMETWITQRHAMCSDEEFACELFSNLCERSLIVFVGISGRYRHSPRLLSLFANTPSHIPILLFNCFLECDFNSEIYPPPFALPTSVAYMIRAVNQVAFARYSHRDAWHLFVEISTFEYESIDSIPTQAGDEYAPTVENIRKCAALRAALKPNNAAFYASARPGRNAGFWPFMTVHRKYLYPLHGDTYRDALETPQSRKRKSTPFGFF